MSLLIEVQKRFRVTIKNQSWDKANGRYITTTEYDAYLTEDDAKELRKKLNYQLNKKYKE